MKISKLQTLLLCIGIIVLAAVVVIPYQRYTEEDDASQTVSNDDADTHWVWKNPVTLKEVSIPSEWKQTESENLRETMLTLTHWTGESLIYIVSEKTVDNMSLSEYIDVRKSSIQRELGIEEFEVINNKYKFYQAEGARYLGDTLAGTQVRIWSHDSNSFWRIVTMTDLEYKNLEYKARKIVDLLMETTR